jgi:hypothetical protein
MTDDDLMRALRSVGMTAFVGHLALFEDTGDAGMAAERLQRMTGWQPAACRTRVSNARAILRAGRRRDALALIAASARVGNAARDAARRMLRD